MTRDEFDKLIRKLKMVGIAEENLLPFGQIAVLLEISETIKRIEENGEEIKEWVKSIHEVI